MSDLINMDVCDVIQDIIPLYHDNVCSNKSKQYVENHIKSCKKCEDLLKSLDAEDSYEKNIKNETQMVLAHHAKQEKTLAMKAGMVIAGLLLLPIIIVLLVTLLNLLKAAEKLLLTLMVNLKHITLVIVLIMMK